MKASVFKEKIISRLPDWIDNRINHLVAGNPAMTMVSAYLKRGAQNYLALNRERISTAIDHTALFLGDETGNINPQTLFEDLEAIFEALPLYPFDFGFVHGTIGNGEIRIAIPDNLLCTIIFGNVQSINIKMEDFLVLRDILLPSSSEPKAK